MDNGNTQACDPTANNADDLNKGFIAQWNRIKQSKEVELSGRLHSYICKNPTHLLPGVRMQIKLSKARRAFYLMNKDPDSKVEFKFLEA
jgi:RNase P subunit RPR2